MKHNNFKQRVLTFALAAVFAIGSGFFAVNSYAADASSTATGTVIVPIAVVADGVLSFGNFAAKSTGSTVIISTSGDRTGTALMSNTGSTPRAAKFDVSGFANATYTITHTALTALTGISGDALTGPATMALTKCSSLTADGTISGDVATGTLSAGGGGCIYVGGTLTVGASQAGGEYTGSVEVTVEYN